MSSLNQSMKEDLHKDPRALEREADVARTELEHTLEALEQRLSPGAIVDQVMRLARQNGGEFGSNLVTQVRNNPLPTLLVSAGLTWLMAASKRAPEPRIGGNGSPGVAERASSVAGSARDAAHRLSDRARGTAGSIRHAGSRMAHSARTGAYDLREGVSNASREHPLVLGALAVATGAAIAAWLPPSEAEDEWIGEASDDAKSRVKEEARDRMEQAKGLAAEAADTVREKTQTGNSPGGSAGEQPTAPR